jgi:hypothetical protein
MKTETVVETKIRSWCSFYFLPFSPAVIYSLAAIFFAARHSFLFFATFLFLGVISIPIAIIQHRRNRQAFKI